MTVIIYRDGIMAADSGGFIGDVCVSRQEKKIFRAQCGALIGCTGSTDEIDSFVAMFDRGESLSDFKSRDGFGACIVYRSGQILRCGVSDDKFWQHDQTYLGWAAVGAHPEFVLALILTGKSAVEVVEAACEHCAWVSGPVVQERLDP